jgi:hypothetical protein
MPAQQFVGDMFDGDEVCRCMFGAHPAFIVAEAHVHQPMHAFDGPMAPHGIGELVGLFCGRGDVKAGLCFYFLLFSRSLSTMTTALNPGEP